MRDILGQLKSIDLKAIDLKSVDLSGIDVKRVGTAAATLAIALGAGFYMQSNSGPAPVADAAQVVPVQTASVLPVAAPDAPDGPSTDEAVQKQPDVTLLENAEPASLETAQEPAASEVAPQMVAEITTDAVMPNTLDASPVRAEQIETALPDPLNQMKEGESFDLAALEFEKAVPAPVEETPPLATNACAPTLTGSAGKMAMISLAVSAPCHAEQEIEFSHAGLRFTERLDANGTLSLDLPALEKDVRVTAHLADDSSATLEMSMPDATQYRRVALMWRGATGLQLHAFEEGADYGDIGHVWAEQPGDLTRVEAGIGGYTTMLGSVSSGFAADVYSFPAYLMRSLSGPNITIEAQIMETTCAAPIEATFLRSNGKAVASETPIQIASPGCEAVGEYLVLQDLPSDMRLALN